ncbi:MAG: penicillin-binding protein 2 [Planctomycetes bacterium]|nr:penicillin-binding protein 2 [Planctomycetota bacterium]
MSPVGPQYWRFGFTIAIFIALFASVGYRLHHLQIDEGQRLAELGSRQHDRRWAIPAARGNLYDEDGCPLAESVGTWTLTADPVYMEDRLRATVELSRILGTPRDALRTHFEATRNGRTIARGLDDRQADAIRALNLSGVYLRRQFTRMYREGGLAAHVLGFVSADSTGGAGIERALDKQMAGVAGHETLMIDAHGTPVLTGSESTPAKPGAHVQLTLNVVLQRILEKEVAATVERHAPKNVAAIVVRPSTGEIVAMASWPSFSPADLSGLDDKSMRNNALSFVYEPGSTMKPLVAGAAVAEKLTTWSENIYCERGRWTYRDGKSARTITDHSVTHGGHTMLSVTQGIALSDNILMAKLGLRLGAERLFRWETAFNMGRKTGICLPGEDAGIMLPRARWTVLGSCMSVPMGHEIAVTPLQLAMAHAAVANGGVWLPPRVVKRVYGLDAAGETVDLTLPALATPRRIFTSEDAFEIQNAMTHTMTEGTGKAADLDGYTAAGKTGTAEKLVNGRYSHESHVGSFVCWAPAERGVKPELLCLAVVDDPTRNGHYGSETAAPMVQHVLQQSLEYLRVPKTVAPAELRGRVAVVERPTAPEPARSAKNERRRANQQGMTR